MKKLSMRIAATILTLLLCLSVFAGCTQVSDDTTGTENGSASKKDPLDKSEYYEVILFTTDPKIAEYQSQNYFDNLVKEKFNFGVEYVNYPGDPLEKLALMLSAGDYTDLVITKTEKYLKAYVDAGALIELDPLIEKYGENIKKTHKERIPYWRAQSGLNDGKLWYWTFTEPSYSYGVSSALNEWKIRSDILEQQEYPEVRNEDDVFALVKQGVKDNPTTNGEPTAGFGTPLRDPNSIECATYFFDAGRLSHMTYKNGSMWDTEKGEFIDAVTDYSFKDGLLFYNRMWREGLVDRDVITYSSSEFQNKMSTGYGLCTYFYGWNWQNWNENLGKLGHEFRYVPIPSQFKQMQEKGHKKIYPITNGEIWSSYSITTNAKYPERIMEVADWMMSEEGLIAAGWGEKGVQYTINSDGLRIPTAEHMQKMQTDENYKYTCTAYSSLGLFGGLDSNGQNYRMSADSTYVDQMVDPKVYDVYSHYGWMNIYEAHNKNKNFESDYAYPVGFTMIMPNYSDEQNKNWERIDTITVDYTIKLITAESLEQFNTLYEELIQNRKDLGIDEMIKLRNETYDELMKGVK